MTVGGDRPAEVFVPSSYDGSKPLPLVVLLHGYTASGAQQEAYFKIRPHAESRGFLYVAPDGTKSPNGPRFWNATDACCDYSGTEVDDAAYLRALVDEAREKLHVDDKRIYFIGHSNGGFMSHRMACEHADRVAAIASFAGALWKDEAKCNPSEPVAVLQAHGTNDAIVSYEGGSTAILGGAEYPGAEETTLDWAAKNGCSPSPDDSQPNLDLVTSVPGAETERVAFTGCKAGGRAELWSLQNAGHVPSLSEDFIPSILDFLFAHPKP